MTELAQQIQSMELSKTEKRIADYILENINTVALQTVTSLAERIGTSDTSVIRLVRRLGFHSYADFKRQMSQRMEAQYATTLSGGQKYIQALTSFDHDSYIASVANRAIENLTRCAQSLKRETVDKIAGILTGSRCKYIAGFGVTSSCAAYLSNKLLYFLPNIICLGQSRSSAIHHLVDIGPEDCLFLFSFPRYSDVNFTLVDLARTRGAPVILMTDQVTSPLCNGADVVLTVPVNGYGYTNSYLAPMYLSEIIVFAVADLVDASQRANLIDDYLERTKLY